MFRFWASQSPADPGSAMAAKSRRGPIVQVPIFKLKRKRADSDSDVPPSRPPPKAARRHDPATSTTKETKGLDKGVARTGRQTLKDTPDAEDRLADDLGDPDTPRYKALQESIENQFGLEILLKHNELRLIDQEIAKCQVALEQLRRCHLIPYPSSTSLEEPGSQMPNGAGSTLSGKTRAPNAPAWGVTDGPYTRHYARWLIEDENFGDNIPAHDGFFGSSTSINGLLEGRTTRGSFTDFGAPAGQPRSHRNSAGSKLQALSNGYPQPREKAGPLIVKRSSDGQYVKLVCLDCNRGDFSSAQGFINHCRIAHHRGFESHDAAAIACGQPVDFDEGGAIVGAETYTGSTAGLVHPLIRSAPVTFPVQEEALVKEEPEKATKAEPEKAPKTEAATRRPPGRPVKKGNTKKSNKLVNKKEPSFVPSPQTPHLSELMRLRGFGVDLGDIVAQASVKSELEMFSSSSSEEEEVEEQVRSGQKAQRRNSQVPRVAGRFVRASDASGDGLEHRHVNGIRQPARSAMSPAPLIRSTNTKGLKPGRKPLGGVANTIVNGSAHIQASDEDEDTSPADENSSEMSPATVESNQAPSLVSDDDEFEARSESDSPSSAEVDENDGFLDVEVDDEDTGAADSETTATDPELTNETKSVPKRRATALRSESSSRNLRSDRHVTFASPAKGKQGGPKRNLRRGAK